MYCSFGEADPLFWLSRAPASTWYTYIHPGTHICRHTNMQAHKHFLKRESKHFLGKSLFRWLFLEPFKRQVTTGSFYFPLLCCIWEQKMEKLAWRFSWSQKGICFLTKRRGVDQWEENHVHRKPAEERTSLWRQRSKNSHCCQKQDARPLRSLTVIIRNSSQVENPTPVSCSVLSSASDKAWITN